MKGTIDIETFPGKYRAFVDKMWKTNILKEDVPTRPASFSYKRLGRFKPYTRGVWQYKNEKEFVKDLHRIFDENDILIGHNAKRFDLRQSNTFFAMHGLPETRTEIEDTMTIIKKRFKLPSYKLKYCLTFFKIGEKMRTGGEDLWFDVEDGDLKARKHFLEYNENDTVMTEKLYVFLEEKGWTSKNTKRFFSFKFGCPRCRSIDVQSRGERPYADGWHDYFFCKNCGKYAPGERVIRPWR